MTKRTPLEAIIPSRIIKLRERLAMSASGFVRASKFGVGDRAAMKILVSTGEVDLIKTSLGSAYRLVPKAKKENHNENPKEEDIDIS